jgi:hypothetical protein
MGYTALPVCFKFAYSVLVRKVEERISLRRHVRRWEDNIKVYFQEVGRHGLD